MTALKRYWKAIFRTNENENTFLTNEEKIMDIDFSDYHVENLAHLRLTLNAASEAMGQLSRAIKRGNLDKLGNNETALNELRSSIFGQLKAADAEFIERKERKVTYQRAFTTRVMSEIPREIKAIEREISQGEAAIKRGREKILAAGLHLDEAVRLFPDYNQDAHRAKIKVLYDESRVWEDFMKHGIAKYMPPDADAQKDRKINEIKEPRAPRRW